MPKNNTIPYDIECSRIKNFIEKHRPKHILIQVPHGLKFLLKTILECIEEVEWKPEITISGNPAYGACDLAVDEAQAIGADTIIHLGHTPYPYIQPVEQVKTLYIPVYYTGKTPRKLLEKIEEYLEGEKIVLTASIQYIKQLKDVREYLEKKGYKTITPKPFYKEMLEGQIIGCIYSHVTRIKADTYIVLSSGYFHAIGLCLSLGLEEKKIILADIHRVEAIDLTRECRKIIAKRIYIVSKLLNTPIKSIAIINGVRPGQYRPQLSKYIKELYRRKNIEVYNIVVQYIDKNILAAIDQGLDVDAYIILNCPRLPVDDLSDFYKPVLTPGEAIMVAQGKLEYKYPW